MPLPVANGIERTPRGPQRHRGERSTRTRAIALRKIEPPTRPRKTVTRRPRWATFTLTADTLHGVERACQLGQRWRHLPPSRRRTGTMAIRLHTRNHACTRHRVEPERWRTATMGHTFTLSPSQRRTMATHTPRRRHLPGVERKMPASLDTQTVNPRLPRRIASELRSALLGRVPHCPMQSHGRPRKRTAGFGDGPWRNGQTPRGGA